MAMYRIQARPKPSRFQQSSITASLAQNTKFKSSATHVIYRLKLANSDKFWGSNKATESLLLFGLEIAPQYSSCQGLLDFHNKNLDSQQSESNRRLYGSSEQPRVFELLPIQD